MVLGVYGSGGLGREIMDLAQIVKQSDTSIDNIFFIDDVTDKKTVNDINVFTFDNFCDEFEHNAEIVVAVGEPEIRALLAEKVTEKGYRLRALIHPNAHVGTNAQIGEGAIICSGCFVSCNTKIGINTLMQPNAIVGHDSVIGNSSVISSFVVIAGNCFIGEKTYVGLSVSVIQNATIGSQTIIGMGSSVLRNIPDGVVALGNPARAIKNNDSKRVFTK